MQSTAPLLIFQGHVARQDVGVFHPLRHVWMTSAVI